MDFLNSLRKILSGVLLAVFSISTLAQNKAFDPSRMDNSVEACADFFQYSNGNWIKNTQIPGDRPRYDSFNIVYDKSQTALHEILENAAKNSRAAKGSDQQLIGDIYASCIDEAAIEALGTKPIEPFLKQIEAFKDVRTLPRILAENSNTGVSVVFTLGSTIDAKNSNLNIAEAGQSGLSLPTPEYYLSDKFKEIRAKFVQYASGMFQMLGASESQAKTDAETVLRLQTRLATASKSPQELRDAEKNYNKIRVADLQKITPNFDWNLYLKTRGAPAFTEINVGQPEFFTEFNRMLADVSVNDWKTLMRWKVLTSAANFLPKKFVDAKFDFESRTLMGIKEQPLRWKRCSSIADATVGEALGAEYVKTNFTTEARKRMNELIDNLFAAYRERIAQLDWMSPETKEKALFKLNAYKRKIGYNEHPRGYKGLLLDRESYFGNFTRSLQFQIRRDLSDIGTPVDKTRWWMTPQTINAGYTAQYNDIMFPAAILQPPFFDFAADDAINYGAIGAVIGHEITHGFDDDGSRYDAVGNLKSWWTPEDRQKFDDKANCVTEQFSGYEVLPEVKINGALTLGENIADLGGLTMAYNAFKKAEAKSAQKTIDGFTPEQRFFLGWAQVWAEKATPEILRYQILNDYHANARFRVNGPLSNLPMFAEAFGCKLGDKMVREKRCQIW